MAGFKKHMKNLLLMLMVATLIGAFVLIFLGHYTSGIIVGGVFMFLANSLSKWFSLKNDDYVHRNIYENKGNKWD